MFGEALETKEAFIDYKNIDLEKTQNLHFSKVVRRWFLSKMATFSIFCFNEKWIKEMVLIQKWPFFQLFFLGNIAQKMSFTLF